MTEDASRCLLLSFLQYVLSSLLERSWENEAFLYSVFKCLSSGNFHFFFFLQGIKKLKAFPFCVFSQFLFNVNPYIFQKSLRRAEGMSIFSAFTLFSFLFLVLVCFLAEMWCERLGMNEHEGFLHLHTPAFYMILLYKGFLVHNRI